MDNIGHCEKSQKREAEQVRTSDFVEILLLPNLSELLSIFGCPKLGDHILHISALMFKVNMTLIFGNPKIN